MASSVWLVTHQNKWNEDSGSSLCQSTASVQETKSVWYLAALGHIYHALSQTLVTHLMSSFIELSSTIAETTNKKKSNLCTGLSGEGFNRVNLLCCLARDSLLNSPRFVFGKARIRSGRKALQPSGAQQKIRAFFYHSTVLFHPRCRKDYAKGHCFLSSGRLGSLLRGQNF